MGRKFIFGGSYLRIDSDATAFLTATGITDATITSAINKLVVELKYNSIWSKMKAIYPFVGGTASTHKFNLKDPRDLNVAFRLTFHGGWTFAFNGVTPNGINAYASTHLIENGFMNVNSNGLGIYLGTNNTPLSSDPVNIGAYTDSLRASTIVAESNFFARMNSNFVNVTNPNRIGFYSVQKISPTVTRYYKNGVELANFNSGGALPTNPIYIGNTSFVVDIPYGTGYSNNRFQFAFVSDGLDGTENANLQTIVQQFQTSLSR